MCPVASSAARGRARGGRVAAFDGVAQRRRVRDQVRGATPVRSLETPSW